MILIHEPELTNAIKGDDFPYEALFPVGENSEVVIVYPDTSQPDIVLQ